MGSRRAHRQEARGLGYPVRLRSANDRSPPIAPRFSVVLERIVWELRGRDCIQIDEMAAPRKKLMTSRSFGRATGSRQDLREAICQHATRGGEKLRGQGSLTSALVVFIQTNPFREGQPQYAQSALLHLPQPTDDSRAIIRTALQGLDVIYRPGYDYQRVRRNAD